jgi:hypothetical protein
MLNAAVKRDFDFKIANRAAFLGEPRTQLTGDPFAPNIQIRWRRMDLAKASEPLDDAGVKRCGPGTGLVVHQNPSQ